MTIKTSSIVVYALKDNGYLEGISFPYIYSWEQNGVIHFSLFKNGASVDIYQQVDNPTCLMENSILTSKGSTFLKNFD